MNERSKIGELKGIGEKTEKRFEKIGVRTVGDLIRYYPRSYEIFEDPVPIGEALSLIHICVYYCRHRVRACRACIDP